MAATLIKKSDKKNQHWTMKESLRRQYSADYDIGQCCLCGVLIQDKRQLTRDHLVPICRGGADARYNIGPAHPWCNCEKSALTRPEFFRMKDLEHEFVDAPLPKIMRGMTTYPINILSMLSPGNIVFEDMGIDFAAKPDKAIFNEMDRIFGKNTNWRSDKPRGAWHLLHPIFTYYANKAEEHGWKIASKSFELCFLNMMRCGYVKHFADRAKQMEYLISHRSHENWRRIEKTNACLLRVRAA